MAPAKQLVGCEAAPGALEDLGNFDFFALTKNFRPGKLEGLFSTLFDTSYTLLRASSLSTLGPYAPPLTSESSVYSVDRGPWTVWRFAKVVERYSHADICPELSLSYEVLVLPIIP